jgi:hypothetical protein
MSSPSPKRRDSSPAQPRHGSIALGPLNCEHRERRRVPVFLESANAIPAGQVRNPSRLMLILTVRLDT